MRSLNLLASHLQTEPVCSSVSDFNAPSVSASSGSRGLSTALHMPEFPEIAATHGARAKRLLQATSFFVLPGMSDKSKEFWRHKASPNGASPFYLELEDMYAPCKGPKSKGVFDWLMAMNKCKRSKDCDWFVYIPEEQMVQLCKGDDFFYPQPSAGTYIGVKADTLQLGGGYATIANYSAFCPAANRLAEYDGVHSLGQAADICKADHRCTHFTLDVSGSRSTPLDRGRLSLCSGDPLPLPRPGAVMVVDARPTFSPNDRIPEDAIDED